MSGLSAPVVEAPQPGDALAPLIRAWPGEGQHARAVLGLECLRAIGSETALMQIHGIAQRVPFKGLKAKAAPVETT